MSNFIEQCVASDVMFEDIDDFIDQWHEDPGGQTLHDFLGMTRYEYSLWLADQTSLPTIVDAHARKTTLEPGPK